MALNSCRTCPREILIDSTKSTKSLLPINVLFEYPAVVIVVTCGVALLDMLRYVQPSTLCITRRSFNCPEVFRFGEKALPWVRRILVEC